MGQGGGGEECPTFRRPVTPQVPPSPAPFPSPASSFTPWLVPFVFLVPAITDHWNESREMQALCPPPPPLRVSLGGDHECCSAERGERAKVGRLW